MCVSGSRPARRSSSVSSAGRPKRSKAEELGWAYRRLAPLDDVLAANLKWLAGYRHPRNAGRPGLTRTVVEAFTRPRPLIEAAEAAGDPIEVLPAVFHALWHGRVAADLEMPLHERVLVGPPGWNGPGTAGGAG
ncbi:TnsA-like heteromeric transposase endonuclease subunit [Streptomyces sp. NPDC039028]|uniref:TnsA-like heteromeric transposase endonuclease subunit n=1 Tax=unclassified Streptomyces TaxID=2593676 RepID=UPI0033F74DA3